MKRNVELLLARPDAHSKFGGDELQMRRVACALADSGAIKVKSAGWDCDWTPTGNGLLHIFNVDRPLVFLHVVDLARKWGVPFAITPIHHDLVAKRRMKLAARKMSVVSRFRAHLPDEVLDIGLVTLSQGLRCGMKIARPQSSSADMWRLVGDALDEAVFVQTLASGETESLIRDTGWSGQNACIVPNGVDRLPSEAQLGWSERSGRILVVGRIEPRKRQLEVARLASKLGMPIDFVGGLDGHSRRYVRAFLTAMDETCRYLGSYSHAEVLSLLGARRSVLNASVLEVQSLVDLEAYNAGCVLTTGGAGYSRELLGHESIQFFDSTNLELGLELAQAAAETNSGVGTRKELPSWDDVGGEIRNLYESHFFGNAS